MPKFKLFCLFMLIKRFTAKVIWLVFYGTVPICNDIYTNIYTWCGFNFQENFVENCPFFFFFSFHFAWNTMWPPHCGHWYWFILNENSMRKRSIKKRDCLSEKDSFDGINEKFDISHKSSFFGLSLNLRYLDPCFAGRYGYIKKCVGFYSSFFPTKRTQIISMSR